MSFRLRTRRWLDGLDANRVRCPDGEVRLLTFREFLAWQRAWSEAGAPRKAAAPATPQPALAEA